MSFAIVVAKLIFLRKIGCFTCQSGLFSIKPDFGIGHEKMALVKKNQQNDCARKQLFY